MSKEEKQFLSASGIPIKRIYTPEDVAEMDYEKDLGDAGQPPYTRGAFPGMHRSMPWRIRQLTGVGSIEGQNERIKLALEQGEATAVNILGDTNTWGFGYDLDDPEVVARKDDVGVFAAPICSLQDFELLFDGIPIDNLFMASLTTSQQAPFGFGGVFALAEKRGIPLKKVMGSGFSCLNTDYLAVTKVGAIAPRSSLKMIGDSIEFCVENVPRWTCATPSGYNTRECGITAPQEIGLVIATCKAYIEEVLSRGKLKIDDFAYTIAGSHLSCDRDFFEEIAKFRAIRRMWARMLRDEYKAQNPQSLKFTFHVQTSGACLTYQQPLTNVVRVAYHVLSAALGGANSVHAAGYEEAFSAPSADSALLGIRTQQIAQYETNIINAVDPLGGSYYVEALTDEVEQRAWDFVREIHQQGGYIEALESGWLHQTFLKEMVKREQEFQTGQKKVVGVNCFQMEEDPFMVPSFENKPPKVYDQALARLQQLRKDRDNARVSKTLDDLKRTASTGENVMPAALEAVRAYATIGEINKVWREVFPLWEEPISL